MIRNYDNTKNYGNHQIKLMDLEIQFEILQELKKLNKTLKKGEKIKRLPVEKTIKK